MKTSPRWNRTKRSERGAARKRWHGRIAVAVVFPDTYGVGMTNLGLQTLYGALNAHDHIVAERFFVPEDGSPGAGGERWLSEESARPLRDFDLILFTLSFESTYPGLVQAIADAGMTLRARDRGRAEPLVLAGGVATFINPEPVAPFVDAFLIGEYEGMDPFLVPALKALLDPAEPRPARLRALAERVPGAYVPGAYHPRYDGGGGFLGWDVDEGFPFPVPVARAPADLPVAPRTAVLSSGAAFADMFLVELVRGCGRGCRFCAAGFVYRPPRAWSADAVRRAVDKAVDVRNIGLVGLEYMGKTGIEAFIGDLLERGSRLAFSSLRVDALTPSFVSLLKTSGVKTATVAPEAGSDHLRKRLNKHLTEETMLEGVEMLAAAGIPDLKLYFMLGLPGEEDGDMGEIIRLTERIRGVAFPHGRSRGREPRITVSASVFVPKAWTPFQWAGFAGEKTAGERIHYVKCALPRIPNVAFNVESPRNAEFQAVMSRGDRRLAPVLEAVALRGVKLHAALRQSGLSAEMFAGGREQDEPFPWEVVGHPVRRAYLLSEWRRSLRGEETASCDIAKCRRCGACRGDGRGK